MSIGKECDEKDDDGEDDERGKENSDGELGDDTFDDKTKSEELEKAERMGRVRRRHNEEGGEVRLMRYTDDRDVITQRDEQALSMEREMLLSAD
uniref:Uncharacterized protein n=1 Tax=Pristionchus pacificus TaxID=54126 RepID=A0A2A6BIC4_PRIPA|eukprot:PDM65613.1 hypothetical protein PRIPAC_53621 [Pristionchus pacificus]